MKTILFLCTGNVCRSPMAEGLFRHAVKGRGEFRVLSAGLGAVDGQPPTSHSVQAMKEIGIDISRQRSRALTADLVRSADLILGMTHSHTDTVALLYPSAAERTFLLREFDDTLEPYEKDISDPIGCSYPVYVECRDQIEQGIVTLMKFMEQHDLLPKTQTETAANVVNFALGADHGGFELKESLKAFLRERGLSITDFGATSKDPADDYPDFALPAAQGRTRPAYLHQRRRRQHDRQQGRRHSRRADLGRGGGHNRPPAQRHERPVFERQKNRA
jgi:protein-tyrosine-phosphatase